MNPGLHARLLAVKRRLLMRFGGGFDPYPEPPTDAALSPSAAHFVDYETAPLALSWRNCGMGDVAAWQAQARAKLAALCGYTRQPNAVEVLHRTEVRSDPDYERRHFYLRVREGSDVPVTLLRPCNATGTLPVMICLQGTNSGAHLSWGEARMPADPLRIAAGGDYARQAAQRGYAAVCIEQSAFGERRERTLSQASVDPCIDAANHALLLGRTLIGERASDVSAAVDWLKAEATALSIDVARTAVMGSSSGGSTAVMAAALDPRIGAVLASGCVGYIRETIGRRGHSSGQNIVPGILEWLEYDDVLGLIAPRPLLVISGESDHIWPYAGAARVVESARQIYTALGVGDAIRAVAAPGGHRFYPDPAWRHFAALVDCDRAPT